SKNSRHAHVRVLARANQRVVGHYFFFRNTAGLGYKTSVRRVKNATAEDAVSEFLHNLDVVAQSARGVVAVPCDPILGIYGRGERTKYNAGVRDVFDLLPSQRDPETLRHKANEPSFKAGIREDSGSKSGRWADSSQPVAKARVSFFRHPHKEHSLQI